VRTEEKSVDLEQFCEAEELMDVYFTCHEQCKLVGIVVDVGLIYYALHFFTHVIAWDDLAGSPPDYVDVEAYQQTKHIQDDTARALGTCAAAQL
jgi:hypothetical protein